MHAPALDAPLVARLFEQSGAAAWELSVEQFEATLAASLASAHARAGGATVDADKYLSGLHVADLALAAACAAGCSTAWEHFDRHYRPLLQRAAAAIDHTGSAELADSLFGDLFGLETKAGVRQSLFRYFHGRSKLSTWLRAVLAQRHVDRVRISKRHEPLPDEDQALPAPASPAAAEPERARFVRVMRETLSTAIAGLASQDRLRLSLYYAEDMTLASIGKMLGEHEATVSRQLARTRREIRKATEERLRATGLDDQGIVECFQSVTADAGELDLGDLLGTSTRKNAARNRSTK